MIETIQFLPGDHQPRLAFRRWAPTSSPRGIVVIVPGFNAHSGYYEWAGSRLADRSYATFALDLRGRGGSSGPRYAVADFDDYVSDVERLTAHVKTLEPSVPLFLLGHSAGGVVACLYALQHQQELSGLISESFAHELPAPDVALAIIKGLSHLAPHAHVLSLKNEDFSRDRAIVHVMNHDPLIAGESQPAETLAALVRADQRLKERFREFRLPLLILHGAADKAAKPSGSRHFWEAAGSADKTLKIYDESFHDPLNDLDREQVLADILSWLDAHADAPSSST